MIVKGWKPCKHMKTNLVVLLSVKVNKNVEFINTFQRRAEQVSVIIFACAILLVYAIRTNRDKTASKYATIPRCECVQCKV